jgi:hypothetical protein
MANATLDRVHNIAAMMWNAGANLSGMSGSVTT